MEVLNELDLLKIKQIKSEEYLLTFDVNREKKVFTVYIDMVEPIFGVNFSDDFIYISRNYRSDIQKLIKIIKNLFQGNDTNLPISLLVDKRIPELQAV